eukprot:TRINITY_DN4666_c0_g2_i1.p1 TRINITY_DN4666_c0_g2~~TRINITY_DN4666_c0_g2_i1.p1  ORF type:complete len:192 (-),score=6.80 TRINITY_DN4666_c0_g2_i1:502-1077(-)
MNSTIPAVDACAQLLRNRSGVSRADLLAEVKSGSAELLMMKCEDNVADVIFCTQLLRSVHGPNLKLHLEARLHSVVLAALHHTYHLQDVAIISDSVRPEINRNLPRLLARNVALAKHFSSQPCHVDFKSAFPPEQQSQLRQRHFVQFVEKLTKDEQCYFLLHAPHAWLHEVRHVSPFREFSRRFRCLASHN